MCAYRVSPVRKFNEVTLYCFDPRDGLDRIFLQNILTR